MGERIEGTKIRRVRVALGEDQTSFGKHFGVTRRTIIRWEQAGNYFFWYVNCGEPGGTQPPLTVWKGLVCEAAVKAAAIVAARRDRVARKKQKLVGPRTRKKNRKKSKRRAR